jgi:dTDP-4-amino-4,6-dideoxygalactose transaminase
MSVPLFATAPALRPLLDEVAERQAAVLRSGRYILGPEVEAFEREFAAFLGVRHCVGVGNGTDALTIALRALGVGEGDEVVVPALTFFATAEAVVNCGAIPVFSDVDPATLVMTAATAEPCVGPRTRALVPVHLYGNPAPMDALRALASAHGLALLEDAAQAAGARYGGKMAGALGDAATFSFFPSKNLGGFGDGGAVVTDDDALAETVRVLRNHARTAEYDDYAHDRVTGNSRLSEVEAAALRVGLRRLAADNARRAAVAAAYRAAAPDLRWQAPHPRHVYHLCVARVSDRHAWRASRPFATAVHYGRALTQQPGYQEFVRDACAEAEAWAAECVSFPCFPEMTDDEIEAGCRAIR